MRLQITITFFSCSTLLFGCTIDGTNDLDRTGTLWAPYLEWELENSSWEGNPFDVEANVTFTHDSSDEQWTTSMFYDGDESWKFRFTAPKTGRWTFRTSSEDTDLDGKHGTANVNANSDPEVRGFIVGHSNKYAWQVGENGEVDVFVPNIYMNMMKFGNPERCGWTAVKPTFSEPQTFAAYLDEAEEHGSNGVFAQMGNQWFKVQVPSWSEHESENPDLTTFRAIEQAITQAHRRGMFLHIWKWGDEQRHWTPKGVGDGINGEPDRRLQRYIAARLGPLPGWTMSYGFDLNEWVEPGQVEDWSEELIRHSGRELMLSARNREEFQTPESLPVAAYDDRLEQDFFEQANMRLVQSPPRPVLFGRRFSYLRDGIWDMDRTRQAFWEFTLAGGAASIWGHYPAEGNCSVQYEGEYPNPEQLRTHRTFWQERFLEDLEPAKEMSQDDETIVVQSDNRYAVFYRQNTDTIHLDLSGMEGSQRAVAVDTKQEYTEIDLGPFEPTQQTWQAPHHSDWAIAVGF